MASAPCCEFCCVAGHVCRPEAILRGDCPARKTGVSLWWRFGEADRRSDQISSLAGHSFLFSQFSRKCATRKQPQKELLQFLLSIRRQFCGLVYCRASFQSFQNEYCQKPLYRFRAPLLTYVKGQIVLVCASMA